ncbi:unnamed protein product, partial [Medioppia subpectinata]
MLSEEQNKRLQLESQLTESKRNEKSIEEYEKTINDLNTRLNTEEMSFMFERKTKERMFKENEQYSRKIQFLENEVKKLNELLTANRTPVATASPMDISHSLKRKLPTGTGSQLAMADEDREFMDPNNLIALKRGECSLSDSHLDEERLSVLQRRNTLVLPHLKTSYGVELPFMPNKVVDSESIKNGFLQRGFVSNDSLNPLKQIQNISYQRSEFTSRRNNRNKAINKKTLNKRIEAMEPEYDMNQVVKNPYILERILSRLDIRSLLTCHMVSKDFFDASDYEHNKRKDIIHLYLLNTGNNQFLFESFSYFTKVWLNMKPKYVFLMIGGNQHSIDYRFKQNTLKNVTQHLSKDCQITFLDVGQAILTSSMSCLIVPDIEGIEVKAFREPDWQSLSNSLQTENVKCVLFFQSSRVLDKSNKDAIPAKTLATKAMLQNLIQKFENKVAFGGGDVAVVKHMTKCRPIEDRLLDNLVLTIGGQNVRSASIVLETRHEFTIETQLSEFKKSLDFDCNQHKTSTTIAILFANRVNFSLNFSQLFQNLFPAVALFGSQTNEKMFGKFFAANDKNDNLKDDEKNVIKSSDELKKSEENVSQRSADLEISDGKSSDDKMIIKKTKSGQTDDKKEMKGERSAVHGKRGTTDPKSLNL